MLSERNAVFFGHNKDGFEALRNRKGSEMDRLVGLHDLMQRAVVGTSGLPMIPEIRTDNVARQIDAINANSGGLDFLPVLVPLGVGLDKWNQVISNLFQIGGRTFNGFRGDVEDVFEEGRTEVGWTLSVVDVSYRKQRPGQSANRLKPGGFMCVPEYLAMVGLSVALGTNVDNGTFTYITVGEGSQARLYSGHYYPSYGEVSVSSAPTDYSVFAHERRICQRISIL